MNSIVIQHSGVCSREVHVEYDDNKIITKCEFVGGCQGNTKGIASLVIGMKADEVIKRLEGITCKGSRNGDSSCPDQLAKGLKQIL